jgi:hypothetical protein
MKSKKRVKVKHIVRSDSTYCAELFAIATDGYKQVMSIGYAAGSPEEIAAMDLVKEAFKTELDNALLDAYKIGTKIGVKKADKTDTGMYTDPTTPIILPASVETVV